MPTPGTFTASDAAILAEADGLLDQARAAMGNYALHEWLAQVWQVVGAANRYFAAEEPWIKRKTDPARMETVLYVTAEVLRNIALLVQPVMPSAAGKIARLARRRTWRAQLRLRLGPTIGSLPERRFRLRASSFPATSNRTLSRQANDADRQPLPSRFSGIRGGTARGAGPRPERRRRAVHHHLDQGGAEPMRSAPSPSAFRTCSIRSAPIRIRPPKSLTLRPSA